MPLRNKKIAVVLPNGLEYSSRLMTGVNYFRDEDSEFEPIEFRFTLERDDPLPEDLSGLNGVIAWVDRSCGWVNRFLEKSVKVVNCCFDWQGTPGVVSLGLDKEMSCDLVLAHVNSLGPREFVIVGVDFAIRPHVEMLCRMMFDRAQQDGLNTLLYEIAGPHPDELRNRVTDVSQEPSLLGLLSGLPRPAAIWCENDFIARMVCNAAAHLGIVIPQQLAVIGSGDYRIGSVCAPMITTLPRPAEEIGYAAAKTLQQWLSSDGLPPPDINVAPRPMILRESSVNAANWDKIRMARDLIVREACQGITVERVCRRIELSKMTFTKRYSEMYGTTPGADIGLHKAEHAMQLLRESNRTISDIGIALGFSEQSKFSKFFKRQTGKTPSEYRQSFQ